MPYQLTPDEKRRVDLFTRRVEELEKTPLYMKKGVPDLGVGLSMSYKRGEHFRVAARGPDENDLRAALTIIRQFYMDREPVFVNRIYNLCTRGIKSSETDPVRSEWANNLKKLLEEQRGIWRVAHQRCGGFRLVIDGKDVRPEEAWDLWINGHYFTEMRRRSPNWESPGRLKRRS